ncbi:hypothetical protein ABLE91_26395 [Aquabacter sp. CN5-332]|uniref:hypothetical protein n=1 Tax=Aquabacter sp. CN5-332 TaxID=3156608 RepID=UPI0032B51C92
MRHEDPGREYQELLRMRADLAGLNFMFKLAKFIRAQKANFNRNQPRVPIGHREGGRWTRGDYGEPSRNQQTGGPDRTPDLPPSGTDNTKPVLPGPNSQAPSEARRLRPNFDVPFGPVLRPRQAEIPTANGPLSVDDPPSIPPQRPISLGERLRTARSVGQWLLRAATLANTDLRITAVRLALHAAQWMVEEYWPYVEAYWEGPRTLLELQEAVKVRRRGTDIHHIVEQTQARKEGFPESAINSSDNLVQISTFTHWQITAWYQTPIQELDWLTPREYLRDKDWDTKYRMGIRALENYGVLIHGNH